MVSVKVMYRETGNPAKQTKVGLSGTSIFSGGVYNEYTDSDGEAHFASVSPGEVEIYVEGKVAYKGQISGMKIVYI